MVNIINTREEESHLFELLLGTEVAAVSTLLLAAICGTERQPSITPSREEKTNKQT